MKSQHTDTTDVAEMVPAKSLQQEQGPSQLRMNLPGSSLRRLFVSLPVPESVQNSLASAQTLIKESSQVRSLAWANPTTLHMTLQFLGDVEVGLIPSLKERLRKSLASCGSFTVQCRALDWLPSTERPRVLFTHIVAQPGKLEALQARVRDASTGMGEPEPDRPFVGHVTLARIRRKNRIPRETLIEIAKPFRESEFGIWKVNECHLMASELHSGGAQHTVLARFPLE